MRYWILISFFVLSAGTLLAQPDKAEIRKGNQEFNRKKHTEAEIDYRRALDKDSTSILAHYNLNNTRYRLEQFAEAEKGLTETIQTITDPIQRAYAFHNLGNMQLKQKKYKESIDSYKNALRLRPNDMETKSNLAYAQKMDQEQDDQGDGESDQDQDDQDQNQGDQNPEQNQDQQNQKEQEVPPKITPQAAQQMLEAMMQKEKETQEKVNREKVQAVPPPSNKNW